MLRRMRHTVPSSEQSRLTAVVERMHAFAQQQRTKDSGSTKVVTKEDNRWRMSSDVPRELLEAMCTKIGARWRPGCFNNRLQTSRDVVRWGGSSFLSMPFDSGWEGDVLVIARC